MKKHITHIIIVLCLISCSFAQNTLSRTQLALEGISDGGTLTLMKAPGWNYPYIELTNSPGEQATSVISRISTQTGNVAFEDIFGEDPTLRTYSNSLDLIDGPGSCGGWIIGGSESGLGIPEPPHSLSVRINGQLEPLLSWRNGDKYDCISVIYGGLPIASLPGEQTSFIHSRESILPPDFFEIHDITYLVLGIKNGVPSNGQGVRLTDAVRQESLMNIPFTRGVAPGFQSCEMKGGTEPSEGRLLGVSAEADLSRFRGRGFYQVINGSGSFSGGVKRRFSNLEPGEKYKISASVIFLSSSDSCTASFSLYATSHSSTEIDSADYSEELTLLNKDSLVRQESISVSDWERWSSDDEASSMKEGIMLQEGSDTIILWFVLNGSCESSIDVGLQKVQILKTQ